MKLSKKEKSIIVGATQEKLFAIKRAVHREIVRKKVVYNPENKSKMGLVVKELYEQFLVKKVKIRKDSRNVLYTKFKKRGMWSGTHYVYRDKLRLSSYNSWQSFILDYANRENIKKLQTK